MHHSATKRQVAASSIRVQMIQRVLVDGWSTAQAAQACGATERQVARWLAAYRRRGMASLREPAGRGSWQCWAGCLCTIIERAFGIVSGHRAAPAPSVFLPRRQEEGRQRR